MASSAALRVLQSRSFVVAGALVTPAATALCEKKDYLPKGKDGSVDWSAAVTQLSEGEFWDKVGQDLGGKVQSSIETGVPTQLSYGFVSGYCSGLALKTVGKAAATIFGLGFITLQTLSYQGYINVDHVQIRNDVMDILDLNDDGKVDSKDSAIASKKVLDILQFNMPAGGGFAAGFFGGLRSG